ncbi:MAG TPA: type II toxin-antitoxin system RelE/ParE family toxin [Urbifossiella sp.]|nr:type II toxin-antitoxin system RelE/ParE family toxin [Urbifossiella sp.]
MKPVVFHTEADAEFRAAITYLNDQRADIGYDFSDEVEAAVGLIGRQPKLFPPHGNGFRKCVVRRFGYLIVFFEYDDFVWVSAVYHGRRDPNYWRHRQPQ